MAVLTVEMVQPPNDPSPNPPTHGIQVGIYVIPNSASVVIVVTGRGEGLINVQRIQSDGRNPYIVGSPFAIDTEQIIDAELPLEKVQYIVSDDISTVTLEADLSHVTVPWLSHPSQPYLSQPVTAREDNEWTLPPQTFAFDVIGNSLPVYVWYPRSTKDGTLLIDWEGEAQRDDILALFETGAPLLIRYPMGSIYQDGWIGVGEVDVFEEAPTAHFGSIRAPYVTVPAPYRVMPTNVSPPGWTWEALVAEVSLPTWDAVYHSTTQYTWPTWIDLISGMPTPPAAVALGV